MGFIDNIKKVFDGKIFIGKPNGKEEPIEEPVIESVQPEINSTNDNKVNMNNNPNNTPNFFEDNNNKEETSNPSFDFKSEPPVEENLFAPETFEAESRTRLQDIEELEKKDTHYVFLFGNPGTGKSYITASLIYYMKTGKLGTLRVANTNSRDSEELIQDMYDNFQAGRFIDRTDVTRKKPFEIDLIFTPKDKALPKMKITFLEISGEHLKQVQVEKKNLDSGKLPDDLDTFFMAKIKMLFILVAQHDRAQRDSLTIDAFLDYVLNKDENFEKSNYLLAISKWDTYKGQFKNNIEKFTADKLPNIHNRLITPKVNNAISHYTIGRIMQETKNGVTTDHLIGKDITRAEVITNWLYKTITGKSLIPEPTAWEKLRDYLGF